LAGCSPSLRSPRVKPCGFAPAVFSATPTRGNLVFYGKRCEMANKIFISYKFGDTNVYPLKSALAEVYEPTTVRTYVDKLQDYFDITNFAINKGERDDEDLSDLSDDQIWEKLKDLIFDSTITIVMISPNMKEYHRSDKSQWIPWEISFSLKETTRNDRTSLSNAILAVALPDSNGSYEYFISDNNCISDCSCRTLKTDTLFTILHENMFNQKEKTKKACNKGNNVYSGDISYIASVKWADFIESPQEYIKNAIEIKKRIDEYDIIKEVN
jgi:hypothetical protein